MTNKITEFSQGVCQDGSAILKDGQVMTIEEILAHLRYHHRLRDQLIDCLELMEESERRYDQGQEAPNMNEEVKYTRALLAEFDNLENGS